MKLIFTFLLLSSLVPSGYMIEKNAGEKAAQRAICGDYYDPIKMKHFSICGANAYTYYNYDEMPVVTQNKPVNPTFRPILNSYIFGESKSYGVFNVSGEYFDVIPAINTRYLGLYKTIHSKEPYGNFSDADQIVIQSVTTMGYTYSQGLAINAGALGKIKALLAGKKVEVELSTSLRFDKTTSFTEEKTLSITKTFNRTNVNGVRLPWRIELYSIYVPLQVRKLVPCSNPESKLVCKGTQGSYVSQIDYIFLPVGNITEVECYQKSKGISGQASYDYLYFNETSLPVPLSQIVSSRGFPHIRLENGIKDIHNEAPVN